jgi:tetratricopeptide (TPR) repeat protein
VQRIAWKPPAGPWITAAIMIVSGLFAGWGFGGCASDDEVVSFESRKAHAMNELGLTEYRRGELKTALVHFQRALQHAEATDNRIEALRAHVNIGQILTEQNHVEEAGPHFDKALRIARDMDDDLGLYNALEASGRYRYTLGRYDEAEALYQEAMKIAGRQETPVYTARLLNNLGVVYEATGRRELAVEKFNYALTLFENLKGIDALEGRGSVCNNLAAIREDQGRYQEAWNLLANSLTCYQQVGAREALVTCHANMGRLLEKWGKTSDALLRYERAYGAAKEIPNTRWMEICLLHIVRLSAELGMESLNASYSKKLEELRLQVYGEKGPG